MSRTPAVALVLCFLIAVQTGVSAQRPKPGGPDVGSAISLLDAYERSERVDITFADPRTLRLSLEVAASGWIAAAPGNQRERRRRIAAMIPLEHLSGDDVLEWACDLLRKEQPSEFERIWMHATLAARAWMEPPGGDHFEHAADRFPADARLQMLRLLTRPELYTRLNQPISRDLLVRSRGRGMIGGQFIAPPRQVDRTLDDLWRLAVDRDQGPEARVRLGQLHFLQNRMPDAEREASAGAGASGDPFVQNLGWLTAGLALTAQGRDAAAVESYRRAVRAEPTARASATLLAVHEFLAGRRRDAESWLEGSYSAENPALDPWQITIPDARLFREYRDQLRAMVGHHRAGVDAPAVESLTAERASSQVTPQSIAPAKAGTLPDARLRANLPAFHAGTSVVAVDVSVKDGKTPVSGLMAGDFEIWDNGVKQQIRAVVRDPVPLDVSVVLDLSDVHYRFLDDPAGTVYAPASAESDVRAIARQLGGGDRLRVMHVYAEAFEVLPLGPADVGRPWRPARSGQHAWTAALYDATANVLLRTTTTGRRHVVLMFTDGLDGTSVLRPAALLEVARQSDAVLHLARRYSFRELMLGRNPRSTFREDTLLPPDPSAIERIAEATGGSVTRLQPLASIAPEFIKILEGFRSRYLLHFTPEGVPPGGWHRLEVKVTRSGRYTVDARRGYFGG